MRGIALTSSHQFNVEVTGLQNPSLGGGYGKLGSIGTAGLGETERYCSACSDLSARQKHPVAIRRERFPGEGNTKDNKEGSRGQKGKTSVSRPMGGVELDKTNDVQGCRMRRTWFSVPLQDRQDSGTEDKSNHGCCQGHESQSTPRSPF